MKKKLCLLGVLASLSATPVLAGVNPTNWTGLYGGVALGWGSTKGKKDFNLKLKGFNYGLELGGGAAVIPNLYLGANFTVDFSTASQKYQGATKYSYGGQSIDISEKLRQKPNYTGTLQIGVPLCNFMPYVEVGYGKGKITGKSTYSIGNVDVTPIAEALGVPTRATFKTKGPIFGLGLKYQPAKSVLLGISYRHCEYKAKATGATKSNKIRNDAVRVSASYLFNF